MDGKDIDPAEHKYIQRFCSSGLLAKAIDMFAFLQNYHEGLIGDLSTSLEFLHNFLGHPESYLENMAEMEKEYREATDFHEQMLIT